MIDNIVVQLDKAYYVRSKISYYPLSHSILPVPDGVSAVIFENQESIDQYFEIRGVNDPENFEVLPIISFYDFMREVADTGFIGIWFFNKFPILFGNYISDIDIELPSFAYTYDGKFIGGSGEIETLEQFIPWKNYSKTDKMIRRFVQYVNGVPFDPKNALFTIVNTDQNSYELLISEGKEHHIRYSRFPDASPLQGPYVSDMGAYCLFTDEEYAQRYLQQSNILDKSIYAIDRVDEIHTFLDIVSVFPNFDIGINPGNERYLQGYFFHDQERWFVKTVFDIYELHMDNSLKKVEYTGSVYKNNTIESPNTLDPSLRGFETTIKNPLKNALGTTKNSLPRREAEQVIKRLIDGSKYVNVSNENYSPIGTKDVSVDSFLVFGFDKVSGHPFGNNDEMVTPYVFKDILDAILYFYHALFSHEYQLRFEGFYYCQSNIKHEGSKNKDLEEYTLSEHRLALHDLIEMILSKTCKVEHGELLKSFINRASISLEIEECGYLGDLGIYKESFIESYAAKSNGSEITEKIVRAVRSYRSRVNSKIELDEKYQNKIRIYLGSSYEHVSLDSLCILESALKQFGNSQQRINHDYAGISMKLCKVFEREFNILVFQRWKEKLLSSMTKASLKKHMKEAENNRDETTRRLIGLLLKKNKLELGAMTYVIRRLVDRCDNEILTHLKEFISTLNNHNFILSEVFLDICRLISTRYRNGGVHEKIVTYDICKEAFENILMKDNNYLKELTNI